MISRIKIAFSVLFLLCAGFSAQVTIKQFNLAVPPSSDLLEQLNGSFPQISDEVPVIAHSLNQYDSLKKAGHKNIQMAMQKTLPDTIYPNICTSKINHSPMTAATTCDCWLTVDNTYSIVPFQFATGPDYRNDDLSSPAIALPFNFCFYGQNFNTCFINNNGNVSFGSAYGTFSSSPFPTAGFTMVAPFWADVDTRNLASGLVYYKVTPTALIVIWDVVGYYSMMVDKINSFQLIITNGADPLVPNGNNTSFCYGDMQWTTGAASGGTNGFNNNSNTATPATVGANLGNGINYVQFGRFGQPGIQYTGPNSLPPNYDGVSWLDNQSFVFNACSNNIPPVASGIALCDTISMCEGDTLNLFINFASPENNQITTASASAPGLQGFTWVANNGNNATVNATLIPTSANAGYNTITFTATDNGVPPMTTTVAIVIFIDTFSAIPPVITGNAFYCAGQPGVILTGNNPVPPYGSYLWSTSATTQSISNATSGVYTLTVEYNGCYKTDSFIVAQWPLPTPVISGQMTVCGTTPATLVATDSAYATYLWSNGATTSIITVMSGQFTVTVTDTNGCVGTSAAVNVAVNPPPTASFTTTPSPTVNIGQGSVFVDASTVTGGNIVSWFWSFGDGGFSTQQNPSYNYTQAGTYTIMLIVTTDSGCVDTTYYTITVENGFSFYIPNSFTPNNDGHNEFFGPKFFAIDESSYEMYVFDRWGMLIFRSENVNDPWNGKVGNTGNEIVQENVYVYLFKYKDLSGREHSVTGHISVIK